MNVYRLVAAPDTLGHRLLSTGDTNGFLIFDSLSCSLMESGNAGRSAEIPDQVYELCDYAVMI